MELLAAIQGLIFVVDPEADWIERLGRLVTEDPSAAVKLAAANGLQAIDTAEAFQALAAASRKVEFDVPLGAVHKTMQQKFLTGKVEKGRKKRRAEQAATRKKKAAKVGLELTGADYAKLGFTLLLFLVAVALGLQTFSKMREREKRSQKQMQEFTSRVKKGQTPEQAMHDFIQGLAPTPPPPDQTY